MAGRAVADEVEASSRVAGQRHDLACGAQDAAHDDGALLPRVPGAPQHAAQARALDAAAQGAHADRQHDPGGQGVQPTRTPVAPSVT